MTKNRFLKRLLPACLSAALVFTAAPGVYASDFSAEEPSLIESDTGIPLQEEVPQIMEEESVSSEGYAPAGSPEDFSGSTADTPEMFSDAADNSQDSFDSADSGFTDETDTVTEAAPDYIKGRPLTEEERAEQLAPFQYLSPLPDMPDIVSSGEADIMPVYGYPARYNAKDAGLVTPSDNQNPFGMCWAFTLASAMETSLLKKGQGVRDLSEEHLAYFFMNRQNDPLGNTPYDKNTPVPQGKSYHEGGNPWYGSIFLSTWSGMALEALAPQPASEAASVPLDPALAYRTESFLKDAAFCQYSENQAKSLILQYGSAAILVYMNQGSSYYNADTAAYCYNTEAQALPAVNHAVTLIGWDDTYSKSNFPSGANVKNDGAWIAKNSWGTAWGDNGCFYISYEDPTLRDLTAVNATAAQQYPNNYFYDGSVYISHFALNPGRSAANIFRASAGNGAPEALGEVTVCSYSDNSQYGIQIYTDLKDPANPSSGTPAFDVPVACSQPYAGIATFSLPKEVVLLPGMTYSVVITNTGSNVIRYCVEITGSLSWISASAGISPGQSFMYSAKWSDFAGQNACARIKAHTRTLTYPTLSLSPQSTAMTAGETQALTAVLSPNYTEFSACTYSSSNTDVVKVDSRGTVTALKKGTADITCKSRYFSDLSAVCRVTVTDPVPTGLTVAAAAYNKIRIRWNALSGIQSVLVYRAENGGREKKIASVSATSASYTDKTVQTGSTYTYRLRAKYSADGRQYTGGYSAEVSAAASLGQTVCSVKASGSMYNLVTWKKIAGAEGYYVYRKKGAGGWKKIASIGRPGTVKYKDTGVTALAKYKYYVRAYRTVNGRAVFGPYTASLKVTASPASQSIRSIVSKPKGLKLAWTPQKKCDGYRIFRKTAKGSWKLLADLPGGDHSSYVDGTAKKKTTYYYAVRAYVLESYGRVDSRYTEKAGKR